MFILMCGHAIEPIKVDVYDDENFSVAIAQCIGRVDTMESKDRTGLDCAIAKVLAPEMLKEANFQIEGERGKALSGWNLPQPTMNSHGNVCFSGSSARQMNGKIQIGQITEIKDNIFKVSSQEGYEKFQCYQGDSGATVYTASGELLGMHIRSKSHSETIPCEEGVIHAIEPIFSHFQVQLATWENKAEWMPDVSDKVDPFNFDFREDEFDELMNNINNTEIKAPLTEPENKD
ncbi:MAG: hypothetical protein JOZ52_14130 [Acidobacteria bacterium]|nr:hypothetical protein [Acidobacteriota bacterium]